MKVKLTTQPAEHIVLECEIPPFQMEPRVLIWGNRVFVGTGRQEDEAHVYQEVFAYVITPTYLDVAQDVPDETQHTNLPGSEILHRRSRDDG